MNELQPGSQPFYWPTDEVFPRAALPLFIHRHGLDSLTVSPHYHQFMEIVVVLGGSAVQRSAVGLHRLRRGDIVILRPGAWHEYTDTRGLDMYDCNFGLELLHRELAWTLEDPMLSTLFWHGPLAANRPGVLIFSLMPEALETCDRRLAALAECLREDPAIHRGAQIGLLLQFLDVLAGQIPVALRGQSGTKPAAVPPVVIHAVRRLEQDLAHKWSLAELTQLLRIDSSHLTRLFKQATGLPPMAYLARCRAERAAQLLANTGESIGKIGIDVGWPDPRHFAERFKAHFGLSATRYRTRFANKPEAK